MEFIKFKGGKSFEDVYQHFYPMVDLPIRQFPDQNGLKPEEHQGLGLVEKWSWIAGYRERDKPVRCQTFHLPNDFWPINVMIEMNRVLFTKFCEKFPEQRLSGIHLSSGLQLTELQEKLKSWKRYTLEADFICENSGSLKNLLDFHVEIGGGIWNAKSVYCHSDKIKLDEIEAIETTFLAPNQK